ncbi:MAG: hypothetical protein CMJ59_15375 [Planctomycetaceae bacterium]|nr:hypothetical protein [Planctomycetaceae bacterium]
MTESDDHDVFAKPTGWISLAPATLLVIGVVVVYGTIVFYILKGIFEAEDLPWWIRFGVPAIIFGFTLTLLTVIIQRIKSAKTDKYLDVED